MKIALLRALALSAALAAGQTPLSVDARVPVNPRGEASKKGAQKPVSRVQARPTAPAPKRPAPKPSGARNPLTGSNVGGGSRPAPRPAAKPTPKPAPKPAPRPSNPTASRPAPKAGSPTASRPAPKAPNSPSGARPAPKASGPVATRPAPKPVSPPTASRPMPKPSAPISRPTARPSAPVANRPSAKPPGGSYNRPGANPARPKPKPKPPVVANKRPKLPPAGQGRPGRPGSNFVPGKVTYPGQIASSAKRPRPNHPARPGNRPQPRPLNQVIGSNVNSNNTNISNTRVNNTTINHIHNTNYNKWVNNSTTIWNNRRVVNNRPVVVNPNFQRSVNYAYRPTSWGGRPWWSSSTYHNWHHGSWNYGWNRSWERHHSYYRPSYGPSYYLPGYRPVSSYRSTVSWGIAAWSLGSLAYELGYNSYRNPYTAPPVQTRTTVINYTQPLSVVASREEPEPEAAALTSEEKGSAATELARASFRNGDYLAALKSTDEAISYAPGDSALHEFRALCLFALARYGDAAGVLNPVLASGPGWDWATMSDFYADGEVYTAQLRKLEDYVGSRPDGADAHFVLGYHYMVGGFIDEAYAMFDRVTELQPADTVASQLRDLAESSSASADEGAGIEGTAPEPEALPEDLVVVPLDPVDLEGSWKAPTADEKSITLALGADGQFSWNYDGAADGKVLEGEWSIDDESRLVLSAGDVQMVAEVSLDVDTLQFVLSGSPVGDPGLMFERM